MPRRLGLLAAKLAVSAAVALLLALLAVVADAAALSLLVYGGDVSGSRGTGRSWRRLGRAGRRLRLGRAARRRALPVDGRRAGRGARRAGAGRPARAEALLGRGRPAIVAGLPGRLRELAWVQWPQDGGPLVWPAVRVVAQPVGVALALSLVGPVCAYLFTSLRGRARR